MPADTLPVRMARLDVHLAAGAVARNPKDAWARERLEHAMNRLELAQIAEIEAERRQAVA